MKNVRTFYDTENDTIITVKELEKEYNEMIADGTLDSDNYSNFGLYLSACMDYNGGTLTEIR